MKKCRAAVLAGILVIGPGFGALHAIGFEAGIGVTQQYPWGEVSYKGTSLDLRNELNYGQINTITGRLKVELPLFLPNLYFKANPMTFEGTSLRSTAFKFGDSVFSAGIPFTSTLKLDHYDATLFYGVPFLKTATADVLNVEFGLNVRIIDFKEETKQPLSGLAQSKALTLGVPMGYAGIQISPIDLIKVEGELKGIAYGNNRFYDAAGRVKLKVLPLLFVSGGYKFQNIHIDQSDVVCDLRFGGPVLEVGLQY